MTESIRPFDEAKPEPAVLHQLKESVALTLESDRLFRNHPVELPPQAAAGLKLLLETELAMQAAQRDWPADPQPNPEVVRLIHQAVGSQTPERPIRERTLIAGKKAIPSVSRHVRLLFYWGGGLAVAASLAMAVFFHHAAAKSTLPHAGGGPALASLWNLEPWDDPELADISAQLNLVEVDSANRRQTSNLEKMLVPDSLTRELEHLENTSLWEESL